MWLVICVVFLLLFGCVWLLWTRRALGVAVFFFAVVGSDRIDTLSFVRSLEPYDWPHKGGGCIVFPTVANQITRQGPSFYFATMTGEAVRINALFAYVRTRARPDFRPVVCVVVVLPVETASKPQHMLLLLSSGVSRLSLHLSSFAVIRHLNWVDDQTRTHTRVRQSRAPTTPAPNEPTITHVQRNDGTMERRIDGTVRMNSKEIPFVTVVTDLGSAHPTWFDPRVGIHVLRKERGRFRGDTRLIHRKPPSQVNPPSTVEWTHSYGNSIVPIAKISCSLSKRHSMDSPSFTREYRCIARVCTNYA